MSTSITHNTLAVGNSTPVDCRVNTCPMAGASSDICSSSACQEKSEGGSVDSDSIVSIQLAYPSVSTSTPNLFHIPPSYIVLSPHIPIGAVEVRIWKDTQNLDGQTPEIPVQSTGTSYIERRLGRFWCMVLTRCTVAIVNAVCIFWFACCMMS